jgi:hypothetical protein
MTQTTVGIDIGQMADPTAVAVAELRPSSVLRILRLERLPLRQSYPQQVERLATLISNLRSWVVLGASHPSDRTAPIAVYIDVTGVGRSSYDMLKEQITDPNIKIYAVTLTAGSQTTRDGFEVHIPKIELVDRLRRLMEESRLEIPADSREARAVATELRMFSGQKTGPGAVSTGAREGAHDDLVIALALSAWPAASPTSRRFQGVRGATWSRPGQVGGRYFGPPPGPVPVRRYLGGTVYSDDSWRPDEPEIITP